MEYFDNAINKTKEVFDVAKQKTTEAVNIGKKKYDIAAAQRNIEKLYTKLGKAAFAVYANDHAADESVKSVIAEIKEKTADLEAAKNELLAMKGKRLCANCGAAIEENATYCSACGEKVTFTQQDEQ